MIETGINILDAILANPMEAIILTAMIVFAYKFFDRETRHDIWRDWHHFWIIDVRFALPCLVHNKFNSYCRLKVEYIEPASNILKELKEDEDASDVLRKTLGLNHPSVMQLIRAMENLELLSYNREIGWYPSEKLLVTSGGGVKKK